MLHHSAVIQSHNAAISGARDVCNVQEAHHKNVQCHTTGITNVVSASHVSTTHLPLATSRTSREMCGGQDFPSTGLHKLLD